MTHNKSLKRRVRARMQKTGESYTAARAQLAKRSAEPDPSPAPTAVDHAAVAGMSDEAVARKTGKSWAQWVAALDALDARSLSHREIAALVRERWPEIGGWWAQTVTVGYERIHGLRAHGQQRTDHSYVANKSRTYAVPVSALYRAFSLERIRERWLDVSPVVRSSKVDTAVRFEWPDGTRVIANFTDKGRDKSSVAIQHTKLGDAAARERAKQAWGERLDALRDALR